MLSLFDDNITSFIKAHSKAVIATVDQHGQPSTSTIFYMIDKHDAIHFMTKSGTAKYRNLQLNNKAGLTILDNDKPVALNMTGKVEEVTDTADRDLFLQEISRMAYAELLDYAPIIKLHNGSFTVMNFIPDKAKLTDFTKPMSDVKEELKDY